jgi:hypothetical protein
MVSSTCFEHPSVHPQEDLYVQFYGISFMHPLSNLVDGRMCLMSIKHILPSTRLLIWMHERNTIKLHVQFFLRMNTWVFETCRRHHNLIKTLMKKVCILLVIITYVNHNGWFKKRKIFYSIPFYTSVCQWGKHAKQFVKRWEGPSIFPFTTSNTKEVIQKFCQYTHCILAELCISRYQKQSPNTGERRNSRLVYHRH